MDFHLTLFFIESESSGRSISPPSSFASGSEAETGEFPRIEEIIPISSIDEYEYATSRKGARCSSSSAAKSSKYYPTSSTTSPLSRDSQQPLHVRTQIINSIQMILWKNILFQCYHQKHNFVFCDFFRTVEAAHETDLHQEVATKIHGGSQSNVKSMPPSSIQKREQRVQQPSHPHPNTHHQRKRPKR